MPTHDVLHYGAVGDGLHNDAPAIQAAIDACHAAGGGTVLLPAGRTYLSGSLELRGQTEFRVERGATLLASPDYADYRPEHFSDAISGGLIDTDSELSRRAWLTAFEAHDLSITGGGVIDGHGRAFVQADLGGIYEMRGPEGEEQYQARPYTLNLIGCQRLDVGGLILRDGAYWTLRLTGCQDVTITNLRLHNDLKLPNNDGIDLDRCKRVRISDCDIVAGDDAICLKACRSTAAYGVCEDITVTNCTLQSVSSAFKIGSECWSPVRNVIFSSSVIRDSHRGLSVQCVDPGGVENVLFSNITIETRMYDDRWWGRGEPVYVNCTARDRAVGVGPIRHLRFRDILARGENGVILHAEDEGNVQDVVLDNVRVEVDAWKGEYPIGQQDFRPPHSLVDAPTHGVTVNGASEVTLRHVQVKWGPHAHAAFGQALFTQRAAGLTLDDFSGEDAHA
ncbi:glycosyl hydrolase family 28 protein [Deinococcus saxicola]|uniref:glycoside hydrolase family 28 protein n=1 Tax=Deinococcus saxicola TaxID=249406 RepID=UPI0039EE6DBF